LLKILQPDEWIRFTGNGNLEQECDLNMLELSKCGCTYQSIAAAPPNLRLRTGKCRSVPLPWFDIMVYCDALIKSHFFNMICLLTRAASS
jgi:hypothetical protein